MEESIMEQNEKSNLLGKAMDVGERLVGVRDEASRLKPQLLRPSKTQ
jgi:hypothetical protein